MVIDVCKIDFVSNTSVCSMWADISDRAKQMEILVAIESNLNLQVWAADFRLVFNNGKTDTLSECAKNKDWCKEWAGRMVSNGKEGSDHKVVQFTSARENGTTIVKTGDNFKKKSKQGEFRSVPATGSVFDTNYAYCDSAYVQLVKEYKVTAFKYCEKSKQYYIKLIRTSGTDYYQREMLISGQTFVPIVTRLYGTNLGRPLKVIKTRQAAQVSKVYYPTALDISSCIKAKEITWVELKGLKTLFNQDDQNLASQQ